MKRLWLTATAKQPILIDERLMDRGNVLQSARFIPGSSLRGAIAGQLLRRMTPENPFFKDAIVNEKLSFGPLLPMAQIGNGRVSPVPHSIVGCKLHQADHPLSDLLFQEPDDCKAHDLKTKQECGQKTKRLDGWLAQSGRGFHHSREPEHRLITSVGLDNRLESAREGQLFSREVLNEGTVFSGEVFLADDLDASLLTWISSLRVGLAKTSGLGLLDLSWREVTFADTSIEDRFSKLQELAKTSKLWQLKPDQYLVTLNLQSPLLLSDAFNNPRLQLEKVKDLKDYGPNLDWDVLQSFGQVTQVGGWYNLINRPKQHRPALAPGSLYALTVKGPTKEILRALSLLELHGLGQGWGAGYGHLITNHPFHLNPTLCQEASP